MKIKIKVTKKEATILRFISKIPGTATAYTGSNLSKLFTRILRKVPKNYGAIQKPNRKHSKSVPSV